MERKRIEKAVFSAIGSILDIEVDNPDVSDQQVLNHLSTLDSMTVLNLLEAIESACGISVRDEDLHAEIFDSFGELCDFVESHFQ